MADIVKYYLNDPTTPDLIMDMEIPEKPAQCDFKVDGYRGGSDQLNTLEHQAACCQFSMIQGINLANRYVKLERWSSVSQLFVQPRAGKQFNAYYDRQGLKFFYSTDPVTGKMIYAVNSTEVMCHELGHAILDALRPDLYHMQSMEIWGFHEAFGDIHAILNNLQHDRMIDLVLVETKNTLRQSNSSTRIAEEMGKAIYHLTGGRMGNSAASLRDAHNGFMYSPPEKLPPHGPDTVLTSECHSFSRVFTGAWWDALVGMFEQEIGEGRKPKDALLVAREALAMYTYKALAVAPATVRFYDAVARAILVVDKANEYRYNLPINEAFLRRGILKELVRPMLNLDWETFKTMVRPSDEVFENDGAVAVRSKGCELLPLPQAMLAVTVPGDCYYEFDQNGQCVGVLSSSPEEVITHARECVDYLRSNDMIRPDRLTPFAIDMDGVLARSHFACGCGTETCGCFNTNCTDPEAPEYLKCWKPENNAGCSCGRGGNNNCKNGCGSTPTYVRATSANRVYIPL